MIYKTFRQKFEAFKETSSERINIGSSRAWESHFVSGDREFADAAVLVPLFQGADEIELILTQRANHLKHHPGQVSFPGGRREAGDESLESTALRETYEETGIDPNKVEIIGHLPRMYTISYYDVDPVVGIVHPGFELQADASEVEAIFSVPLSFFIDKANHRTVIRKVGPLELPMVEFHYQEQRIWGATAAIILMLVQLLTRR